MNIFRSSLFWILGAVIVAALMFTGGSSNRTIQPINYNHYIHVENGGMGCLDCHLYAESGARASIPNIAICGECHDEPMTESPEESLLVKYIQENRKLPWVQINTVRDYAYFSHRRHVKIGKLECQECHGDMAKLTSPLTRVFATKKMNWCIDCHEQKQVTTDCYACHR